MLNSTSSDGAQRSLSAVNSLVMELLQMSRALEGRMQKERALTAHCSSSPPPLTSTCFFFCDGNNELDNNNSYIFFFEYVNYELDNDINHRPYFF